MAAELAAGGRRWDVVPVGAPPSSRVITSAEIYREASASSSRARSPPRSAPAWPGARRLARPHTAAAARATTLSSPAVAAPAAAGEDGVAMARRQACLQAPVSVRPSTAPSVGRPTASGSAGARQSMSCAAASARTSPSLAPRGSAAEAGARAAVRPASAVPSAGVRALAHRRLLMVTPTAGDAFFGAALGCAVAPPPPGRGYPLRSTLPRSLRLGPAAGGVEGAGFEQPGKAGEGPASRRSSGSHAASESELEQPSAGGAPADAAVAALLRDSDEIARWAAPGGRRVTRSTAAEARALAQASRLLPVVLDANLPDHAAPVAAERAARHGAHGGAPSQQPSQSLADSSAGSEATDDTLRLELAAAVHAARAAARGAEGAGAEGGSAAGPRSASPPPPLVRIPSPVPLAMTMSAAEPAAGGCAPNAPAAAAAAAAAPAAACSARGELGARSEASAVGAEAQHVVSALSALSGSGLHRASVTSVATMDMAGGISSGSALAPSGAAAAAPMPRSAERRGAAGARGRPRRPRSPLALAHRMIAERVARPQSATPLLAARRAAPLQPPPSVDARGAPSALAHSRQGSGRGAAAEGARASAAGSEAASAASTEHEEADGEEGEAPDVAPRAAELLAAWARLAQAALEHAATGALAAAFAGRLGNARLHLRACPLLGGCSAEELDRLMRATRVRAVQRYAVLYREGMPAAGAPLMLLAAGSVRLRCFDGSDSVVAAPTDAQLGARRGAHAYCGLEGAASDGRTAGRRRMDSATAEEPCVLLVVPVAAMPWHAREEARAHANMRLLRASAASLSVFHNLREEELRALAELLRFRELRAGTLIVRQGEPATSFFSLVAGAAHVIIDRRLQRGTRHTELQLRRSSVGARGPPTLTVTAAVAGASEVAGGAERHEAVPGRPTLARATRRLSRARHISRRRGSAEHQDERLLELTRPDERAQLGTTVASIGTLDHYKHIGEQGFLSWLTTGRVGNLVRSASVITTEPSWVLEMEAERFEELFRLVPSIAEEFAIAQKYHQEVNGLKRQAEKQVATRMLLKRQQHLIRARRQQIEGAKEDRTAHDGARLERGEAEGAWRARARREIGLASHPSHASAASRAVLALPADVYGADDDGDGDGDAARGGGGGGGASTPSSEDASADGLVLEKTPATARRDYVHKVLTSALVAAATERERTLELA